MQARAWAQTYSDLFADYMSAHEHPSPSMNSICYNTLSIRGLNRISFWQFIWAWPTFHEKWQRLIATNKYRGWRRQKLGSGWRQAGWWVHGWLLFMYEYMCVSVCLCENEAVLVCWLWFKTHSEMEQYKQNQPGFLLRKHSQSFKLMAQLKTLTGEVLKQA